MSDAAFLIVQASDSVARVSHNSFSVSPWDGGGSYRIQMTSCKLHSSHLQIQIENLHPRWQGQWWGLLTKDTSPPAEGGDYPYPKEGQAKGRRWGFGEDERDNGWNFPCAPIPPSFPLLLLCLSRLLSVLGRTEPLCGQSLAQGHQRLLSSKPGIFQE